MGEWGRSEPNLAFPPPSELRPFLSTQAPTSDLQPVCSFRPTSFVAKTEELKTIDWGLIAVRVALRNQTLLQPQRTRVCSSNRNQHPSVTFARTPRALLPRFRPCKNTKEKELRDPTLFPVALLRRATFAQLLSLHLLQHSRPQCCCTADLSARRKRQPFLSRRKSRALP